MAEEIELKFSGSEEALQHVRRLPALQKLANGRRFQSTLLSAAYFDTPEFKLRDSGLVLRVRKEGNRFVQTVKSARGTSIAARREWNAEVLSPELSLDAIEDRKLRRHIKKIADHGKLIPLFAVDVRRSEVALTPRKGASIQAAIDLGTIKALGPRAGATIPVCELELELTQGTSRDLVETARTVTGDLPLTLATQSKADRGYALVEGDIDRPVSSGRLMLDPEARADDAFARILTHCLGQLLRNVPCVLRTRDPEGIHQMRVAMRRMRSALSLFGEPFRSSLGPLIEEIKWLTRTLGDARDLDVFHDEIMKPASDAHGEDERLSMLRAAVRARRRAAWSVALDTLESDRFRHLALELGAASVLQPWATEGNGVEAGHGNVVAFAREHLKSRHAKVLKRARHIEELDAAGRHELRIRLKKLRYAGDFFASLFKKGDVRRFQKRMSELQDILGHLNDANVARALIDDVLANEAGNDGAALARLAYAGGVIVGWHLEHARPVERELEKQWKKFAKIDPFWA